MRIDTKSLVKKLDAASLRHLEAAVNLAVQQKMQEVTLMHWLSKILSDSNSIFCALLKSCDIRPEDLLKTIEGDVYGLRGNNTGVPTLSTDIKNLIYDCWLLASVDYQASAINSGHIFLCLVSHLNSFAINSLAKTLLKNIDINNLKLELKNICDAQIERSRGDRQEEYSGDALKRFTVDLIHQAKNGLIDRAIGRNAELQQVIDILCRRKQNNPILVGEAGVGKTAIVEELAFCILERNVPEMLQEASLRFLDFAALQAGASVQGEFESRIKDLLNAIHKSPNKIILFIDEIHNFLGATGKGADAANLLKPALAKGLSLIGATTWAEYKKSFEKDAALNRRFQLIKVLEPSENLAYDIMRKVALLLEKHHSTQIRESAIKEAVDLSVRYMNHLRLPDKAVSILDSACTRIKLQQTMPPVVVRNMQEQIQLKRALLERMRADLTTPANKLKILVNEIGTLEQRYLDHCENWQLQIDALHKVWEAQNTGDKENFLSERQNLSSLYTDQVQIYDCVDADVVADIVSNWTGIPLSKRIGWKEFESLLNFEEKIKQRVIGQDHAIERIADAIRISKAKIADSRKPLGVFLLVGESGVGKTETALSLAEIVYGSERKIITINMSEYKEGHKVASLIGSPPGYVGYGEGGRLTEQVRRNPYSVVLLDEIEKAHPNIQDLFLQVFDKGTLTDSEGIEVDFKNTIIILTSNLGAKVIQNFCTDSSNLDDAEKDVLHSKDVGDHKDNVGEQRAAQFEEDQIRDNVPQDTLAEDVFTPEEIKLLTEAVREHLLKSLKPEFLGRITLIPYLSLTEKILKNIIKLQFARLNQRLDQEHKATLLYDDKAIERLYAHCKVSPMGARQLEQTIAEEILPDLALAILDIKAQNLSFGCVQLSANEAGFIIAMKELRASEDS